MVNRMKIKKTYIPVYFWRELPGSGLLLIPALILAICLVEMI